ncbi:MAG: Stf0 family sulfotransferase [Solirubrobacteraceae bacterium]
MLKDTGVAGRPEEYFEARAETGLPPHPGDYLEDLPRTGAGIRDDDTPAVAPAYSSLRGVSGYREHLERTFRHGTTPNGVFSSKLMWRQLPELHALATRLPEYAGLPIATLLERLFGSPVYVWMSRGDKVRQAVSMWRALQTRSWRDGHGGAGKGPEELHYRFQGIEHLVRSLETEDRSWDEFFAGHGISALKISYEDDLERDRDRTVNAVLERVGVTAPPGWHAAEPLKRQADDLSEQWVETYHRDCTLRGVRPGAAAVAVR